MVVLAAVLLSLAALQCSAADRQLTGVIPNGALPHCLRRAQSCTREDLDGTITQTTCDYRGRLWVSPFLDIFGDGFNSDFTVLLGQAWRDQYTAIKSAEYTIGVLRLFLNDDTLELNLVPQCSSGSLEMVGTFPAAATAACPGVCWRFRKIAGAARAGIYGSQKALFRSLFKTPGKSDVCRVNHLLDPAITFSITKDANQREDLAKATVSLKNLAGIWDANGKISVPSAELFLSARVEVEPVCEASGTVVGAPVVAWLSQFVSPQDVAAAKDSDPELDEAKCARSLKGAYVGWGSVSVIDGTQQPGGASPPCPVQPFPGVPPSRVCTPAWDAPDAVCW